MRRLFGIFMMVIALFVIGATSVFAQEATPSPEPIGDAVTGFEVVAPVVDNGATEQQATVTLRDSVIAIVVVLAGAFAAITHINARAAGKISALAIERIYQSTPAIFQPALADALNKGSQRLVDYSKQWKTLFEFDDEFATALREGLRPIIQEEMVALARQLGKVPEAPNGEAIPNG